MYIVESLADVYHIVGQDLLNNGSIVNPRGMICRELITPVIQINNPRSRLAFLPERKFNVLYALVESMMLFRQNNKVKMFTELNKRMSDFSDDGETLHGAYGHRVSGHIRNIIDKLDSDKDTRQAVLTIYCNDNSVKTKDTPCTLNLHFMIRDDNVNMITYMRSNDIIWGTPYDIFMFTTLQQVIANTFGIDVGWYRHICSSLHVYEQHFEMLDHMKNSQPIAVDDLCDDYDEFNKAAFEYENLVENNFDVIDASKLHIYNQLILNEKCHRDKTWASENGLKINKDTVPKYIRPFVNRWYKE